MICWLSMTVAHLAEKNFMRSIMSCMLLVVVLAGCSFTQHELNIEAESTTEFNRIKTDTKLVLSFSDERDSTNIGLLAGLTLY